MSMLIKIIIVICLVMGAIIFFSGKKIQKETKGDSPQKIIDFIKENINNEQVSFSLNENNNDIIRINENSKLPLGSTVKIIIAIEYARQAAEGMIDPTELVHINTLETFYIPKSDGGAHPAWLSQLPQTEEFTLEEIAKGMIKSSSNANTEFLMQKLGLDNINNLLKRMEMNNHDELYPIVSALFIPVHLKQQGLTNTQIINKLEAMTIEQYRSLANEIHENWRKQPLSSKQKNQRYSFIGMKFQKIWSDRLPGSTTEDYINLMQKINSKQYFSDKIHHYLDPIMEQFPAQEGLSYIGKKGGSTAFVLTIALYAQDNEGNKTELSFFANDLTYVQQQKLQNNIFPFILKLLQNKEYKQFVIDELSV